MFIPFFQYLGISNAFRSSVPETREAREEDKIYISFYKTQYHITIIHIFKKMSCFSMNSVFLMYFISSSMFINDLLSLKNASYNFYTSVNCIILNVHFWYIKVKWILHILFFYWGILLKFCSTTTKKLI